MLIILHGEDNFRTRIKLNELMEAYMKKHNFSLEKFYAQEISFQEFKSAFESQSLFDESKLIVLENLFKNPQLLKQIEEYFGRSDTDSGSRGVRSSGPKEEGLTPVSTILVLYETSSVAKNKDYKKLLALASKKQEFKKLSSTEAAKWFMAFFERKNINFNQGNIKEVLAACQNDMWQTYNELNKLYTYALGRQIIKEDLKVLGIGSFETKIFPTIDAIFKGNADKAFLNILLHWQKGEHPQYLFSMIERQLRILALVKESRERGATTHHFVAKELKLHPFVVQKTIPLSNKFSWSTIKALYSRVESLDVRSKSGQIDPYLACELLSASVTVSV